MLSSSICTVDELLEKGKAPLLGNGRKDFPEEMSFQGSPEAYIVGNSQIDWSREFERMGEPLGKSQRPAWEEVLRELANKSSWKERKE